MRTVLLTTTYLATLLAIVPAHAQTAQTAQTAQSAQSAQENTSDEGLGEIIVTAQRREESAQKAAIAIDVATPEELTRAGVTTSAGLNAVAPSLFIARAGGANTGFFIRGVGNFTNNAYSDPAVAFSLNGVYLGRPTSTTGTFFDLERVEVLKGPQGTLYGRNATGGAINVIYARPRLGELSGYASASYGNYNAVDLEGTINVPIGDWGAARFSGKIADQDGYNADGTFDDNGEALRAQIYAEPADGFNFRLIADWAHTGGTGPGGSYNGVLAFSPGAPASATAPANYVFVPAPSTLNERSGFHTPEASAYHSTFVIGGAFINPAPLVYPFQDNTHWGVSGEFNVDLGGVDLTVIPAYRESKLDLLFNGPAFQAGIIREEDQQYSVEARFSGSVGPVDWLVGGYHFNEDIDGEAGFNQYFVASLQQFETGTTSNAAFGRLTFNVSDEFRLVGGLRYTDDNKYFDGGANNLLNVCTQPPPPGGPGCFGGPSAPPGTSLAEVEAQIPAELLPFGFPTAPGPANARPFGTSGNILFYVPVPVNESLSTSKVTYRISAEYDVGPRSLLYATYETGYRSGGFSVSLGNETYQPEYINAFTIGSKNRFLDNRLQFNVEAFYWRYRDQQISHFGFDQTGNDSYFTENVGRSTIKGIDVDLEFKAMRNTLLSLSAQYLDSKLSDFNYNSPRTPNSLPPAVNCPISNGTEPDGSGGTRDVFVIDCSGKPGFNSPEWALNAGLEQRFELDDFNLTFNGSARYRSNRVTGFDYLAQMNSGSDTTFDASLTLGPASDKWTITAWVRNLTDETIPGTTQYAGTPGSVISTAYLAPRTYGVRARVDF